MLIAVAAACRRMFVVVLALVTAAVGVAHPVAAQSIVRDTEIEEVVRGWATPVFRSAGLDPGAVRIVLINDQRLNAFVAGGQNVFVHTGLLMRAADPDQVLGVLAHETGHIMGGHLARLPEQLRNAFITSLIGMIAAAGAAAASAQGSRDPRDSGGFGALGPAILGAQELGARQLFSFTRAQESAADQAAVDLLAQVGRSPQGLLDFMELLRQQEALAAVRQDPYLRTHPLTAERMEFLRGAVARSRFADRKAPPAQIAEHARIRAKLQGFLESPGVVLSRYPASDVSEAARYARAIALYRVPDLTGALAEIDRLIAGAPRDPYFHELRGQMLLENGRAADAARAYAQAARLKPGAPLIKVDLAHAILESNGSPAQARDQLLAATRSDPRNPRGWRLLSIAYGRLGDIGLAHHAAAEQALLEGRWRDAREQAARAIAKLPAGSPGWLRAQDVESAAKRELSERGSR